jgi:hypothetical protein
VVVLVVVQAVVEVAAQSRNSTVMLPLSFSVQSEPRFLYLHLLQSRCNIHCHPPTKSPTRHQVDAFQRLVGDDRRNVDAQCSEATHPHLRIIPFHSASTLTEVFDFALVMDTWGPNSVEEVQVAEAVVELNLHLKDDLRVNILGARELEH